MDSTNGLDILEFRYAEFPAISDMFKDISDELLQEVPQAVLTAFREFARADIAVAQALLDAKARTHHRVKPGHMAPDVMPADLDPTTERLGSENYDYEGEA